MHGAVPSTRVRELVELLKGLSGRPAAAFKVKCCNVTIDVTLSNLAWVLLDPTPLVALGFSSSL